MKIADLNLPKYLQRYVVNQEYEKYTSEEHAAWRYIMRQSRAFFSKHAVSIYSDGLKATAIPIDRIPKISEMAAALQKFGWSAVGVEGFIPSSVFLDMLARGLLPIACDMRTTKHLAYTPAPDIVHEAAGHAPILADANYRSFLESYAEIAHRAIISSDDIALYEAIRYLSDIKENPDTTPQEIAVAATKLKAVYGSMRYLSEAGKVARLAWWTTEYGLVGPLKEPKIYGAALLSSVGESRTCLDPKVTKIPLSINCLDFGYDITEPQPQLFVAESLSQLPKLVAELAQTFVFRNGSERGLYEAHRAETVNTVELDSGISISGILSEYHVEPRLSFLKFVGPVQLCVKGKELVGHDRSVHHSGYSSPLGRIRQLSDIAPGQITTSHIQDIGLIKGKHFCLEYVSGFVVEGVVSQIFAVAGKIKIITWAQCKVTKGSKIFFEPEWGSFDLCFGEQVVSVYCGPADRGAYGDYAVGSASTSPGRKSNFTAEEIQRFDYFSTLRRWRNHKNECTIDNLRAFAEKISSEYSEYWLVGLEILEIAKNNFNLNSKNENWLKSLEESILANNKITAIDKELLVRGKDLLDVID